MSEGAEVLAAEPEELRGRKLGEFVLRDRIGEGGFAAVYRCEQVLLGREAVIKVLHHRLRASELVLQRFLREAQIASRLDHPYAAHVYAFGVEPDGLVWIAMEMVVGIPLDRWLAAHGPLSLDRLVELFQCIAEVVQTAHERGIVHRDLKPSNTMVLERAGRLLPKLLDLGIAKLIDTAAHAPGTTPVVTGEDETLPPMDTPVGKAISDLRLTEANVTLGSPHYMSPEQWLDPRSAGPASDLYSLGIMAFEALTGRLPYDSPTIAGLAHMHCTDPVPPLGPEFPPALDAVFQRVLAKTPAARPATPLAFVDEIRAAVASVGSPAPRPRRRLPWILAAIVLAGAAVTVAIVARSGEDAAAPSHAAATGGAPTTAVTTSPGGAPTVTPSPGAAPSAAGANAATSPGATSSGATSSDATSSTSPGATSSGAIMAGSSTGATKSPPAKKAHKRPKATPATPTTPPEDLGADRL